MKKNKVTIKEKVTNKINNKLKDLFEPMLERYMKACYGVLVVNETKMKKQNLTSYEEFQNQVIEFLKKGE